MTLAESTALSAKSEREYLTLRDSMKHMIDGWKADVQRLKEEMARKEETWKVEAEELEKKYQDLYKFVQEERCVCMGVLNLSMSDSHWQRADRGKVADLKEELKKADKDFETAFQVQLNSFAETIQKSSGDAEDAKQTAECVRLIRMLLPVADIIACKARSQWNSLVSED